MASTPLTAQIGAETFLLSTFTGEEALSQLFSYKLELFAENDRDIPLDALVGRSASVNVALADGSVRYFNGIAKRISQGARGKTYTSYRAEVVPSQWLLTRTQRSRIFQEKGVPDILRQVLGSANVEFRLAAPYEPRNYCVQYRETDFNFASRLMEEEGIFYFFKHSQAGHTLVVGDDASAYADVPGSHDIPFDPSGASRDTAPVIFAWEKVQELRSGKVTLRDHNFQLPDENLEGSALIRESVRVGQVTHALRVAGNDGLEIYDYPGGYAKRFDGIDGGGGSQPGEIQKLFAAAQRAAVIRMDEEALPSITINGSSNTRQLGSGERFGLVGHPNGDGPYVLTSVRHGARVSDPQGGPKAFHYENDFTCIPEALAFRPSRSTPKPIVHGSQTAVVVGPAGEEIFTDKYGRVKVQFFWDRDGKKDEHSSCWIRLSEQYSGNGGITWVPRIGQEVIVDFLEGDPDQPLVTGSVFNPQHMPPLPWPPQ